MCDFGDTDLLYRGPGGEQRKLIDEAKRLKDYFHTAIYQPCSRIEYMRYWRLHLIAVRRYVRRYNRYYKQEQPM